ncbi:DNA-binding transcriptional MerR regulator [Kribbella rubisoli]|uniref:DNA-binding transcriptional MerR regulator n=1 Tax=Kribbella rubisoli TaxID=3075929 RepID=A0A4V2FUV5_9ACTN|nr:MerR family transcriptional regulator [Kribbella rubisoli]RZU03476.1 DNA-binding transcriptional MerR regulator [Kribbella rubisoli]
MLTIGQLARYVGVSTKTVRVYHAKGLLPEPERDSSGYRRYSADAVVELVRIRMLADAGVPLARIRELGSTPEELADALQQIDAGLTARIKGLRDTQRRLRKLAAGEIRILPANVEEHLAGLPALGFTDRWIAMERDLWIIVYATHPDLADTLFQDQAQSLTDPDLRNLYLAADHAHDLDPDDPALIELADRIVAASIQRYGTEPPGSDADPAIPDLLQNTLNAASPGWQRLDSLIRSRMADAGFTLRTTSDDSHDG